MAEKARKRKSERSPEANSINKSEGQRHHSTHGNLYCDKKFKLDRSSSCSKRTELSWKDRENIYSNCKDGMICKDRDLERSSTQIYYKEDNVRPSFDARFKSNRWSGMSSRGTFSRLQTSSGYGYANKDHWHSVDTAFENDSDGWSNSVAKDSWSDCQTAPKNAKAGRDFEGQEAALCHIDPGSRRVPTESVWDASRRRRSPSTGLKHDPNSWIPGNIQFDCYKNKKVDNDEKIISKDSYPWPESQAAGKDGEGWEATGVYTYSGAWNRQNWKVSAKNARNAPNRDRSPSTEFRHEPTVLIDRKMKEQNINKKHEGDNYKKSDGWDSGRTNGNSQKYSWAQWGDSQNNPKETARKDSEGWKAAGDDIDVGAWSQHGRNVHSEICLNRPKRNRSRSPTTILKYNSSSLIDSNIQGTRNNSKNDDSKNVKRDSKLKSSWEPWTDSQSTVKDGNKSMGSEKWSTHPSISNDPQMTSWEPWPVNQTSSSDVGVRKKDDGWAQHSQKLSAESVWSKSNINSGHSPLNRLKCDSRSRHNGNMQEEQPIVLCQEFLVGRCRRGNRCRYSHDSTSQRHLQKPESVLQDRFSEKHVEFYENERRSNLPSEIHDKRSNTPAPFSPNLDSHGLNDTPCRDFMKGNCYRGNCCKFSHQTLPEERDNEVKSSNELVSSCPKWGDKSETYRGLKYGDATMKFDAKVSVDNTQLMNNVETCQNTCQKGNGKFFDNQKELGGHHSEWRNKACAAVGVTRSQVRKRPRCYGWICESESEDEDEYESQGASVSFNDDSEQNKAKENRACTAVGITRSQVRKRPPCYGWICESEDEDQSQGTSVSFNNDIRQNKGQGKQGI